MVNQQQQKQYKKLHKKLGDIYLEKEEHRKSVLELYNKIKTVFGEMQNYRENEFEKEMETRMDEIIQNQKKEKLAEQLRKFQELLKSFEAGIPGDLETYKQIDEVMKELIEQHKILGEPAVSIPKAQLILDDLEKKIKVIEDYPKQLLAKLKEISDKVKELEKEYASLRALNSFDDITKELVLGIAAPEVKEAFKGSMEKHGDMLYFLIEVYRPWSKKIEAALLKIAMLQLPEIKSNSSNILHEHIRNLNIGSAHALIMRMYGLLKQQKEGVVVAEKYPKLEEWREFYCMPKEPKFITDEERNETVNKKIAKWEEYKQMENERMLVYHNWCEKRKNEWYDFIQPLNFEYMPELNNLEGDFWVLYAVEMGDSYEEWKSCMEDVEIVIDYEMNEEILLKPYQELIDALGKYDWESKKEIEMKRDKRIYGDDFERLQYKGLSYFLEED